MKFVNLFGLLCASFCVAGCFGKKDQAPAEAPVAEATAEAEAAPTSDVPASDAPAA